MVDLHEGSTMDLLLWRHAEAEDGTDELAAAPDIDAVHEVEAEIGIDDFIDPDTGEPTHGYEPHLRDDN